MKQITVQDLINDNLKFGIEYYPMMQLMVSTVLQIPFDDIDETTILTLEQAKIVIETTNLQSRYYEITQHLELEHPPLAQCIRIYDATVSTYLLIIEKEHIKDTDWELIQMFDYHIDISDKYKLGYGEYKDNTYIIRNELLQMMFDTITTDER